MLCDGHLGCVRWRQGIEFAADGTLHWNGEPASWRMHGETLYVSSAARDCEGTIGFSELFWIFADGKALAGRTQLVLTLVTQSA